MKASLRQWRPNLLEGTRGTTCVPLAFKTGNVTLFDDVLVSTALYEEWAWVFGVYPSHSVRRQISKASLRDMHGAHMLPDVAAVLLPLAAAAGDAELVRHLCDQGASLDYATTIKYDDSAVVSSALIIAARLGKWDAARALIKAGANIGMTDSRGFSLLPSLGFSGAHCFSHKP